MTGKPVSPIALAAILTGTLCIHDAQARMYQWANPGSGTVQLSGSPPPWYRSTVAGPRVLVFDNGQLVDDTAVSVADDRRLALRANAFGDSDPATASVTRGDSAAATSTDDAADRIDGAAPGTVLEDEQLSEIESRASVEQTVAELKSLLDAWDMQRLQEAKAMMRSAAGETE